MKVAVIYASTTGNTEAMANAGAVSVAEPLMVHLTPEEADV